MYIYLLNHKIVCLTERESGDNHYDKPTVRPMGARTKHARVQRYDSARGATVTEYQDTEDGMATIAVDTETGAIALYVRS
jgi:hypothetical protein